MTESTDAQSSRGSLCGCQGAGNALQASSWHCHAVEGDHTPFPHVVCASFCHPIWLPLPNFPPRPQTNRHAAPCHRQARDKEKHDAKIAAQPTTRRLSGVPREHAAGRRRRRHRHLEGHQLFRWPRDRRRCTELLQNRDQLDVGAFCSLSGSTGDRFVVSVSSHTTKLPWGREEIRKVTDGK